MFININEWSHEKNGITVLYPGGYKPVHGGHLDIIKKYSSFPGVKKVLVLVGPKERENLTQDDAFKMFEIAVSHMPKVEVKKSGYTTPILSAYKFMETAPPGTYVLASSKKGNDFNRVLKFTEQHQLGGKYHHNIGPGVEVTMLPIDVEPFVFSGRHDEHEGQYISSSVLRNDLKRGDFNMFKTGYPNISAGIVEDLWNISRDRIFEGGGAGHMKNVWEATDLSFSDLEDIIRKATSGELENVTEKLDGQNLMITWKGGKVLAARNKGHLRDHGKNALDVEEMSKKFEGRETLQYVFVETMRVFQRVFKDSKLDLKKIFKEGKTWLNLEILYPETENVIHYGENQVRMHHLRDMDKDGNPENIHDKGLDLLENDIEHLQSIGKVEESFLIKRTNKVLINRVESSSEEGERLVKEIQTLKRKHGLSRENTIEEYMVKVIGDHIDKANVVLDENTYNVLLDRWAKGDKNTRMNVLVKGLDDKTKEWIRRTDKKIPDVIKRELRPIEHVFLRLGMIVLKNLKGLASSDPERSTKKIKEKLEKSIDELQKEYEKLQGDPDSLNKLSDFLTTQLERLNKIGGLDAVTPTEGIVFEYKGNLLKLTGAFAPINQLIGYLKFGR